MPPQSKSPVSEETPHRLGPGKFPRLRRDLLVLPVANSPRPVAAFPDSLAPLPGLTAARPNLATSSAQHTPGGIFRSIG